MATFLGYCLNPWALLAAAHNENSLSSETLAVISAIITKHKTMYLAIRNIKSPDRSKAEPLKKNKESKVDRYTIEIIALLKLRGWNLLEQISLSSS
jgi:hypothetical protein